MNIGYIQNQVRAVRFTSPFPSDSIRWKGMKIEALVSIIDGWCLDTNLTETQVEIPIKTKLRQDGYVEISTTNTTLNPYSIISIMLYEADLKTI